MDDEVRRLQDRVDELMRVLGQDRSTVSKLRATFDLTPDQGRILGLIVSRNIVSHGSIFTVLYGARPECDQPDAKTLDVQVSYLRGKLLEHGIIIKTVWGEGYLLTADMKAKVRQLVALATTEELAAA